MSYTTQTIFKDARLNGLCDFIIDSVLEGVPSDIEGDIDNSFMKLRFVLTGQAGAILQGETIPEVKNITFITSESRAYDWCLKNLPGLLQCKSIAFAERMLLYPNGYFFEIWYEDSTIVSVQETAIRIQEISQIPLESL